MTKSDRKEFGLELARLGAAYREDISRATAEVYFEELADFDLPIVRVAVRRAIRELKWVPKISELREFAAYAQRRRQESESNQRFLAERTAVAALPPAETPDPPKEPWLPTRIIDEIKRKMAWPPKPEPFRDPTPEDLAYHDRKKAEAAKLLRAMESQGDKP